MIIPLITQLIKVIENDSSNSNQPLDGATKKQIALTVVDHIIKDLSNIGKINPEIANTLITSINILGPTLIDLTVSIVKKVGVVAEEVEDKVCGKCCPIGSKSSNK